MTSCRTSMVARKRPKIAFVGSGNIGATAAHIAGMRNLGECVMFDVVEGIPQGRALDLSQSTPLFGTDVSYSASNCYSSIEGADVVVVTAGVPRKPGMTRNDLINTNSSIIQNVATNIAKLCPNAFVICITNPLDIMVNLLQRTSGLPTSHVVGMAGILDSTRFRFFLAERLGVSVDTVQTLVLGGHGDDMVPLVRFTSVGGISLPDVIKMGWISEAEVDAIVDRTRKGGGEIVQLLKTGSAYYSPAMSAIQMVEAYLFDKKALLPCCAHLSGQYGEKDIYVGVPVIIGAGGVERVVELPLSEDEAKAFKVSADSVRSLLV